MNESEKKENVDNDKIKNGFGLRLAQAIMYIFACAVLFIMDFVVANEPNKIVTIIGVVIGLIALINFVVAFLGRKYRWANIVCIAINAIFLVANGITILGFVGGVTGLKSLPKKEKAKADKTSNNSVSVETGIAETNLASSDDEIISQENQPVEQIKQINSQIKQPNKKLKWALFGLMTAYYLFLLVFGILSMAMPAKGLAWGPYESETYTIAMNVITGFILILAVPSFGYYFALRGPVRFNKKVSVIVFGCCIGLTLIGDILFYVLMGEHLKLVNFSMKIAPVLAEVGLITIYLVGFLHISTEKLTKTKYKKTGNTWKDLLGGFINSLSNGLKFLLKYKNSVGFVIGGTLVFTLCLFVLIELMYVLLAVMLFLLLAVLAGKLYVRSNVFDNEYLVTGETGSTRTLKYCDYYGFTGENIYQDENGGRWATKDGGKTFYPITADNARREDRSEEGYFKNY
ncbi:MAG: hypothetical protein ACI4QN_04145 [Candidatus Coproplasma sp.]